MSLTYPVTAGPVADSETYLPLMKNFYDSTAQEMKAELLKGKNIAIICAGDPFVFGSYMYWHARLSDEFETTVIPGISSISCRTGRTGQTFVPPRRMWSQSSQPP